MSRFEKFAITLILPPVIVAASLPALGRTAATDQPQAGGPAAASAAATTSEAAELADMLKQATNEVAAFAKAKGNPRDLGNPYAKWAAKLWEFREAHPGTETATEATGAALAYWTYTYQTDKASAVMSSLSPKERTKLGDIIDKNHMAIAAIARDYAPLYNWGKIDPDWREFNQLLAGGAMKEISDLAKLAKNGRPASDWQGLYSKWAKKLWEYNEAHPGTVKASGAGPAAIAYMIFAGQRERANQLMATMPDSPTTLRGVVGNLFVNAKITGDDAPIAEWAQDRLAKSSDKIERARMQTVLGRAYQQTGDLGQARDAYQAAVGENASPQATQLAQKLLANLGSVAPQLAVGQPAPGFTAKSTGGSTISLGDYRGKVVVLNLAATWCPLCRSEIPTLKELYRKNQDKGLVVLNVLLDSDPASVRKMVAENQIPWPQILAGADVTTGIPAQYSISGTPTYYVVDRNGKIAGQNVPINRLTQAVETALSNPLEAKVL